MNRLLSFLSLGGALALAAAAPAEGAVPTTNASGTAAVLRPLSLLKKNDLDFGALIAATTAGTATLNPTTGAVTTAGGVIATTFPATAARFVGAGTRKAPVIIRIPKNPITLTRSGGSETMTVSNWTLDGAATRIIDAYQSFEFKVGGQLNIGANQVSGTYAGTFNVTVQYP